MHAITLVWKTKNNHGYPWRAECLCGWQSMGYVAKHAADGMGQDHLQNA